jgi:hypothetical protein
MFTLQQTSSLRPQSLQFQILATIFTKIHFNIFYSSTSLISQAMCVHGGFPNDILYLFLLSLTVLTYKYTDHWFNNFNNTTTKIICRI